MKRISFTILSLILLMTATFNASAQGQNRDVSGFNTVASGGSFNVHIKITGTESVRVDADADIINDIETIVENGTLKIKFKDHENWHRNIHKAEVYVTAKSLSGLVLSGSGSMDLDGNIEGENAKLILSGSGDMKASVKSNKLHTVISGSGSITVKGSANDADIVVTGSGEVNGKDLKTQELDATITGSGNIDVIADKSVSAHITGSGNVVYSGTASISRANYTGSGRVSKAD